ncbi:glycerol kinase-like [Ruditapes philippinarum]|uniref:glycerol kinase-like n=1 Tax=Ruditapes philippinarum TaxID=129788 RepID=UPI00295BE424|nr:glycerol kinase-like [Ruditapes philippinarum]
MLHITEGTKMATCVSPLVGAVDQGTSSSRFLIFSSKDSKVVTYHQVEVQRKCPHEGWVEQDPVEILESVKTCIAKAVDNLKALNISHTDIKCIGITSQRETTIVWDKFTGQPLYNAIVWSDMRTGVTIENLIAKTTEKSQDYTRQFCGAPLSSDFSAIHLNWLLDNCPAVVKAIDEGRCLFGNVDSWLLWNLTGGKDGGKHITDVSFASKTLLLNIHELKWDDHLCQFFGVDKNILPEVRSSAEVYGHIYDGPLTGVPVSGILGDQQAAMVGHSHFKPGQTKITYGTALCLSMNIGQQAILSKSGLLTCVAYQLGPNKPAVYAFEGASLTAGSCIRWLRDNVGIIQSAEEIEELAMKVDGSHGCYFVPAFSGLYCPYFQNDARGIICGISQHTTKEHIARAALEAICFQTKEVVDAANADIGMDMQCVQVDGGMTANNLLMKLLADIIGTTVERPTMQEATALGVAMAAGYAIGIWDLDVDNRNDKIDVFKPTISEKERAKKFKRWNEAVSHSMHWIHSDEQDE